MVPSPRQDGSPSDSSSSPAARQPVRALFLSDCHLGSRHARSEELRSFLRSVEPEQVYLVGDIVDGWALRRRWRWGRAETECLQEFLAWGRAGIPLFYAAGNHDDFLHPFLHDFGFVQLGRQFEHTTRIGKRYLVMHGDTFDHALGTPAWKSWMGSAGYDALFALGAHVNTWRRLFRLAPSDFAQRWRNSIPAARKHIESWEQVSARYAHKHACDGIICGHVHTPRTRQVGEIEYINIGDWMENGIALVESHEGQLVHATAERPSRHRQAAPVHRSISDPSPVRGRSQASPLAVSTPVSPWEGAR